MQLLARSVAKAVSASKPKQDVVMLGPADVNKPKSSKASANTIGEQVASLLESKTEGYTRHGQPRSGTLSAMLAQALQSDDASLLDEVGLG